MACELSLLNKRDFLFGETSSQDPTIPIILNPLFSGRAGTVLFPDADIASFSCSLIIPNVPTAKNITTTGFIAEWSGIQEATNYFIDVSTNNLFTNFVPGFENLAVNNTSQLITGLTPGTNYHVRIRAVSSNRLSSNSPNLVLFTAPVAPNQPTISNVTNSAFRASWNSVLGASSYRIDVATESNFLSGFVTDFNNRFVSGVITSMHVTGLSASTNYYTRIRAANYETEYLVFSSYSPNAVQITALLAAPTATDITTTEFTANWASVPDAINYRIDVSINETFNILLPNYNNLIVNGTSQQITGLTPGTTYYVRIRVSNAQGISANSATLTQITIPAAPNQPTISNINIDKFTVNWDAVTGATSYQIDVATNSDFTSLMSPSSIIPIPAYLQAEVIGVSAFNTYYIRIRAVNSAGISINSEIKTIELGFFEEESSILALASSLIDNKIPPGQPTANARIQGGVGGGAVVSDMFFSNLNLGGTRQLFVPSLKTLTPLPFFYSNIANLCNCFTPPRFQDLRSASGIKYQTITDGFNIYTSSGSGLSWKNSYPSKVITAVDMSRDGQYQVGVGSGVHFSTDFGENWISKNINLQLSDIAISDSGLYQIAVGVSGSDTLMPTVPTSYNLYRSINSGNTWTKSIDGISGFRAVAMSSNGQYQITYNSNGIYTSNNYGLSWELKLQKSFIKDLDISTNGQYQTFITLKEIFNSNDYGNTWTQVSNLSIQIEPFAQYGAPHQGLSFDVNSFAFNKIRISRKNPKYQAINMLYGKIILSVDSGNSWTPLFFNIVGPLVQQGQGIPPPVLDPRISANWTLLEIC